MTKPTRIVGIVVIALNLLWAISMRHGHATFAWIMALVSWIIACVQQSRIEEMQCKLDGLKENQGNVDRSEQSRIDTPPEVPVELVVATLLRTVPTCINIVRKETSDTDNISDTTLTNITVGLFLFFLPEYLPIQKEENIYKMRRAFQTAWLAAGNAGGDEEGTREWFQVFNGGLLTAELPPNRIAISIKALKSKFPGATDKESALDVLVYSVWHGMKTIPSLTMT